MDSDRPPSSILRLAPAVVALVLFGVFVERVLVAYVYGLPKRIFLESSFTIALLQYGPIPAGLGIGLAVFLIWLVSPFGRGRFEWSQIDSSGGFRWVAFVTATALAWAYAGHHYNYFYDQSHLFDRWLIVALLFAILRSPLLIALFLFEVILSRVQFGHPISVLVPIADELTIRVLCIVVGCAFWNAAVDGLAELRTNGWLKTLPERLLTGRIETHALVFAILCTLAFYYVVAAVGKMKLGVNLFDWLQFSHMENLFISAQQNGWLSFLSDEQALVVGDLVRRLHFPIAIMTLTFEASMAFILVRRRGTLLVIAAVCAMHVGIVVTSGILFWKWLALDFSLLGWLALRRHDEELARMYSPQNAVFSLLVIGGLIGLFSMNQFGWWNTKWTMLYDIEVFDEEGVVYRVDPADFASYTLFDLYKPMDRQVHTYAFGMTSAQRTMEFFETATIEQINQFGQGTAAEEIGAPSSEGAREFSHFMTRYFRNRNRHPNNNVAPFWFPAPSTHNRFFTGTDVYRDQAQVALVRLRFREVYYTGRELRTMRDEIVYSAPVPLPDRLSE